MTSCHPALIFIGAIGLIPALRGGSSAPSSHARPRNSPLHGESARFFGSFHVFGPSGETHCFEWHSKHGGLGKTHRAVVPRGDLERRRQRTDARAPSAPAAPQTSNLPAVRREHEAHAR